MEKLTKTICLRVDLEMFNQLSAVCSKQKMKKSYFIRKLVDEVFDIK